MTARGGFVLFALYTLVAAASPPACTGDEEVCAQVEAASASMLQLREGMQRMATVDRHEGSARARVTSIVHPGFMFNMTQLEHIKHEALNWGRPIYDAYMTLKDKSPFGSRSYEPMGPPDDGNVDCGSHSNPNHGCTAELTDSTAAVVQALLWFITEDQVYADNAIALLNAWAYDFTAGHTNSNAPLQAGWALEKWPMAVEILRHAGNSGYSDEDHSAFLAMVDSQYMNSLTPQIFDDLDYNGNWWLTGLHARMGRAIMNDDVDQLNTDIAFLEHAIPAYFYCDALDHGVPNTDDHMYDRWHGQTIFSAESNGVCAETCRDMGHTLMGISSMSGCMEQAYIQGVDLYPEFQERLVPAIEQAAWLMNEEIVPDWLCIEKDNFVRFLDRATFEIMYTAYHRRMGVPLPAIKKRLVYQHANPMGIGGSDMRNVIYEQLHHGSWPWTHPDAREPDLRTADRGTWQPGLVAEVFKMPSMSSSTAEMPSLEGLTPDFTRVDKDLNFGKVNVADEGTTEKYAVRWTGALDIAEGGVYSFFLSSNDGSLLYIDGHLEMNADWKRNDTQFPRRTGTIGLAPGRHDLMILYWQLDEGAGMRLEYNGPDVAASGTSGRTDLPTSVLWHFAEGVFTTTTTTTTTMGCQTRLYGRCGGSSWEGPTCCACGMVCVFKDDSKSTCKNDKKGENPCP